MDNDEHLGPLCCALITQHGNSKHTDTLYFQTSHQLFLGIRALNADLLTSSINALTTVEGKRRWADIVANSLIQRMVNEAAAIDEHVGRIHGPLMDQDLGMNGSPPIEGVFTAVRLGIDEDNNDLVQHIFICGPSNPVVNYAETYVDAA